MCHYLNRSPITLTKCANDDLFKRDQEEWSLNRAFPLLSCFFLVLLLLQSLPVTENVLGSEVRPLDMAHHQQSAPAGNCFDTTDSAVLSIFLGNLRKYSYYLQTTF